MNLRIGVAMLCLGTTTLSHAAGMTATEAVGAAAASTELHTSSSNASTIEAPAPTSAAEPGVLIRPFSTVAVAVKIGLNGAGLEIATPLARKLNLRASGSYFRYSANFTPDGINTVGSLEFTQINTSVDWYPFGGAFRLSPGVTLYNNNHIDAVAGVPAGQEFELNNVNYTSSPTDPVNGSMDVTAGNRVAPSLTLGWGNMIPRKGGHWSVPFEIGAEYIGEPLLTLNLGGSVCSGGYCQPIATNSTVQANEAAEQTTLTNDLKPLRVFPIVSIGVSYKF